MSSSRKSSSLVQFRGGGLRTPFGQTDPKEPDGQITRQLLGLRTSKVQKGRGEDCNSHGRASIQREYSKNRETEYAVVKSESEQAASYE